MNCHRRLTVILLAFLAGCSSTHPRGEPVGQPFPTVQGKGLDGEPMVIPDAFAGQPTLLMVGYKMETQFDIDRWLLAMQRMEMRVPVFEIPTIPGLLPGLFANNIDRGMRSGIPAEDWASVITVYGEAETITRFLGNENPLPARVVLLDDKGVVRYFHDEGFSVNALLRLKEALDANPSGESKLDRLRNLKREQ